MVDNDKSRRAEALPYLPATHRGMKYQAYFADRPNEASACDELYFKMKDSFAAWQAELRRNALWAHLGTFGFWIRSQVHNALGVEPPPFKPDQLAAQYEGFAKQYHQQCLAQLGAEKSPAIRTVKIESLPRTLIDEAIDGFSDAMVRGGRFVYDHPELIVAGLAVGAVIVFVPAAAPAVVIL